MNELFRDEVLAAQCRRAYGGPLQRPPLAFAAATLLAAAVAAGVVALLGWGEYTRRVRVHGVIAPAGGVVKILPPQPGIVAARYVDEGEGVSAGQVLFALSAERRADAAGPSVQAAALEQLQRRRHSLVEEAKRRDAAGALQIAAAERRSLDLEREHGVVLQELATAEARERTASAQAADHEVLARDGFVSAAAARLVRDAALEHTGRRQALLRTRLALEREIAAVRSELSTLPLRLGDQRAAVGRELASLEHDIVVAEGARRALVTAPIDGIVTALAADAGQAVGAQPLAALLPAEGPLEAHLYAPSRAVGFIAPGQAVRIRYAAFPWQKFGQHDGVVTDVARTALAGAELPAHLGAATQGEGLYRIRVRLADDSVAAYGRAQPLAAGMRLEADVLQERRRLIEWVLEPVLGLRGAL